MTCGSPTGPGARRSPSSPTPPARAEEAGAEVVWVPELHRSATVTRGGRGRRRPRGPRRSARRSRSPSPAARWSPRSRRSTSTSCPAAGSCSASAPACSGSTRTGTTSQWGKPVAAPARDRPRHPAVLGRRAPPASRSTSTASTSRCASAATSGPTPVLRADIPIYLAAMGPAHDPAGRRDRRRLDLATSCRSPALPARADPARARGRHRAVERPDPRRHRRGDVGLLLGRRRPRGGPSPRGRHGRLLRDACAPTPTSSPSTASPPTSRRSSTRSAAGRGADDLADAVADRMVDALTLSGTRDAGGRADRGVRRPRRHDQADPAHPRAARRARSGPRRRRSSR